MKKLFLFFGVFSFLFSCHEPEEQSINRLEIEKSIRSFESLEDLSKELDFISRMGQEEILNYEKSIGFKSIGSKIDKMLSQINPEKFSSIEEIKRFVSSNDMFFLVENDGDTFLDFNFSNFLERYVANEEGLFILNGKYHKLFNDGILSLSSSDLTKIQKIENYFEGKNDSEIEEALRIIPIDINSGSNFRCANSYSADTVSSRNKTTFLVETRIWNISNHVGPVRSDLYLHIEVRAFLRTLGVFFPATRTITGDVKCGLTFVRQVGGPLLRHAYVGEQIDTGSPKYSYILEQRIYDLTCCGDYAVPSEVDIKISSLNAWARTPSTPSIIFNCQ